MLHTRATRVHAFRQRAASGCGLALALFCIVAMVAPADPPAAAAVQGVRPAEEVMPAGEGIEALLPASVYPGDYLFDYIDGGAPQYIEYGFHEVASLELKLAGRTYVFDTYRMESPLAAWGIFSTRRPPVAPLLVGFPYSSFTAYQGMAAYGPYFFDISAFEPSDTTAAEMARLLGLAAGRVDPAFVQSEIGLGEPFTRLPGSGRLPGSERLARGPISLRAALGTASGVSFQAVLDAVLAEQAAQALRSGSEPPPAAGDGDTRAAESGDTRAAASSGGAEAGREPGAWWVVSGYHPILGEDGRLVPQTTLALLAAETDITPLLRAAGDVLLDRGGAQPPSALRPAEHIQAGNAVMGISAVQTLAGDCGWSWSDGDGRGGFVLRRGGDLLCASSILERDLLRAWAQSLAVQ